MKTIIILLLFIPGLVYSQSKDTVIVYHGNGSYNSKLIDLSNQGLSKIPAKAVNFQVEVLILDNNNITEIPNWVANLPKLRSLSLRNNNLQEVNPILRYSENLEELYLSGNPNLSSLPSLSNCKKLRVIDVVDTRINNLPGIIRGMENIGYFKYTQKK